MNKIEIGDCRRIMNDWIFDGVKVQMCVTSPPYFGLRDYGVDGQVGREKTPEEYVSGLVEIFSSVRDLLSDDGTLWLNLGDSYWGSWGNAGSRPELDDKTLNQREKKTDYIACKGWDENRERPPSSYKHPILKNKDLIGIPWRVAFALQADGWYLRQDVIWNKPNPMPTSVKDRCTTSHEYIFLLAKSSKYYYDSNAIQEPSVGGTAKGNSKKLAEQAIKRTGNLISGGIEKSTLGVSAKEKRNRRSVWTITTKPYKGAHSAVFPTDLIEPCILAGSRPGDAVFDPFMGSGTTAEVALRHGRQYLGCELNPAYKELQDKRIASVTP